MEISSGQLDVQGWRKIKFSPGLGGSCYGVKETNINLLIIDRLQYSAVKANTEVHKVDGMTTLAWNLWCPSRRQPGSWILNNSEWLCLFFFCCCCCLKEEAYLKELNNSFLLCSPGTGKGRVPGAGTLIKCAHYKAQTWTMATDKVAYGGAECTTWWHKVFWGAEVIRSW